MWQYTNEGSVPGIGGNVDLDIGYIDYPGIIRRAGLNHLSETAPPPAPPSAPTYITYTIQPGDTLSEIAERFGTTVSSLSALNGISIPILFTPEIHSAFHKAGILLRFITPFSRETH